MTERDTRITPTGDRRERPPDHLVVAPLAETRGARVKRLRAYNDWARAHGEPEVDIRST